jgi:hypothetical protein
MTGASVPPAEADLAALAKSKLATETLRAAELDHLVHLLLPDEQVVTLCDALFRSGQRESHGLIALTDVRLICVDSRSRDVALAELRVSAITAVTASVPRGSGDAKRGQLAMRSGGVGTELDRIRPSERADEIAQYIQAVISDREASADESEARA